MVIEVDETPVPVHDEDRVGDGFQGRDERRATDEIVLVVGLLPVVCQRAEKVVEREHQVEPRSRDRWDLARIRLNRAG